MTNIYSTCIIKLLPVIVTLLGLVHAQKIPQEFRSRCTVAENEGCFTDDAVKACPPGYHRNNDYTDCSPRRFCCPCPQGSFQPQRNLCYSCIECKNCSKTNQEVSVRCNITHDTECGDTLTTTTPEDSTSEELAGEEGMLPPDISPAPDGEPTTETPESAEKAGVLCAPTFAFIVSHLACVLVGMILCKLPSIFQKITSCASQIRHQPSSSLEEGMTKTKKKKGKKNSNRLP